MKIGQRIKFFREQKNFTQQQLADNSEISREAVGNYENGRRIPTTDIAERIARSLGVSVNDLIYSENTNILPEKWADTLNSLVVQNKNSDKIVKSYEFQMFILEVIGELLKADEYKQYRIMEIYKGFVKTGSSTDDIEMFDLLLARLKILNSAGLEQAYNIITDISELPKYKK